MTYRKNAFFSKFRAPSFFQCFLISAAQSFKKIMRRGARFQSFWDPLVHFEVEGPRIFGTEMCDRTAGFYHVLSVLVVLSVSVASAMECQMMCLMKCFFVLCL